MRKFYEDFCIFLRCSGYINWYHLHSRRSISSMCWVLMFICHHSSVYLLWLLVVRVTSSNDFAKIKIHIQKIFVYGMSSLWHLFQTATIKAVINRKLANNREHNRLMDCGTSVGYLTTNMTNNKNRQWAYYMGSYSAEVIYGETSDKGMHNTHCAV